MTIRDETLAKIGAGAQPQSPLDDRTAVNIIRSRLGGKVERCHSIPHQGSYSNAAHQWGVSMLLWYLFPVDFPRLVAYTLTHDVPEGWVGDVPATVMRYSPTVRPELQKLERLLCDDLAIPFEGDLNDEDHAKLKACDRLELYLWCCEQLTLGNLHAREPLLELDRYFKTQPLPEPAMTFYKTLQGMDVIPQQAGIVSELVERAFPSGSTLD